MIRVLIVDDSPTMRQAIAAILQSDPEIRVVGEAADGAEGVAMVARLKPDVVTMDIQMPNLNGAEATRQIMAKTPTPIVVVTSVARREMVWQGFDILLAGALEIVQKPSSLSAQGLRTMGAELVAKVKAVSEVKFPAGRHP